MNILAQLISIMLLFFIGLSGIFVSEEMNSIISLILTIAVYLIIIKSLINKGYVPHPAFFYFGRINVYVIILFTILLSGASIILSEINYLFYYFLPMPGFLVETFSSIFNLDSLIVSILIIAVVPALLEEVLFRGYILFGLRRNHSETKSIVISALVFGLVHLNPWQFISAFFLGLLFGWIALKTRSIILPVAGHFLNNIAVLLSSRYFNVETNPSGPFEMQPLWMDFTGILLCGAGVYFLYWYFKLFKARPRKLTAGSTVAIISPSWGGPALFPATFDKGLENIKHCMGLHFIEYPTARMEPELLYAHPELRAKDINNAFADKEIDAIFISIGGTDSIRILPYLDTDLIVNNPKIIVGYSDSSTFLSYLNSKGLITFQGPSVMSGWAQMHNFDFLKSYYRDMLMSNPRQRELLPFSHWSEDYAPWSDPDTVGDVLNFQKNDEGFQWLQGKKRFSGEIWGGCLEVIDWLKGTEFWPERNFWKNKIYMIDTSEEKPSPEEVGFSLRNLGVQGILGQLSGILVGRPKAYTPEEKRELYETVVKIVSGEFGMTELPIVANLDFGHTDPQMIIPLGIKTEIDCVKKKIFYREPFYSDDEK